MTLTDKDIEQDGTQQNKRSGLKNFKDVMTDTSNKNPFLKLSNLKGNAFLYFILSSMFFSDLRPRWNSAYHAFLLSIQWILSHEETRKLRQDA